MKTVLITGGTGFIGSHTCISLLESGYKIIIVDSNINSSADVINKIEYIFESSNKKFEKLIFEKGDIRDEKFLNNIFLKSLKQDFPIEAVIHFAGLKSVEESVSNPLEYWDANVNGSICLFKVMKQYGCKTIVFSSSACVYGNPIKNPIKETFLINPNNPYGYTKSSIEKILKNLFECKETHNWRIANLRYFNPIGAHISGVLGENPSNTPNNLFPYICKVAQRKYERLKIFGNNWPTIDGTGVRDYIHVMDLAEAHLAALEFLIINEPQIINLNIGTAIGTSVLQLISIFEKVNKCIIPFDFSERRPGDVAQIIADNRKVISTLDWRPVRNLEDMCRDGWGSQSLNIEN